MLDIALGIAKVGVVLTGGALLLACVAALILTAPVVTDEPLLDEEARP